MLEVKDEILNGEPKYRLKDENGNIIYDNLSIEQITPVIQEGTPLNKALFDSIMPYLVPSGFIGMWSGSVIPDGWYLCDGTNGTPDLRNRFIVGSGGEYTIGNTGGEKTHTLTVNEMPNHEHKISQLDRQVLIAPRCPHLQEFMQEFLILVLKVQVCMKKMYLQVLIVRVEDKHTKTVHHIMR